MTRAAGAWPGISLSAYSLRASACGLSPWASLCFLTAWWPRGSRITCMVAQCSSTVFQLTRWKLLFAIYDLVSEVVQSHFPSILLVKSETQNHPDSREGKLDSAIYWEGGKILEEKMG